jgi:signal transduction histidine kinase/methyl-accepting chemotaxis protein
MKIQLSSLRIRLLLAFTLVSSFAIVAALAASYSFNEVGKVLQLITTQRVPGAVSASELARSVERIVATAPRLLNASNEVEKSSVRDQLDLETAELNRLVTRLRNTLDSPDFEKLSPAVATLQNNLDEIDAIVGETLRLVANKEDLLKQLEQDYISFERSIAPRLLRAQARLQQLQNAAARKQSVDVDELLAATRAAQPLQQLQLETSAFRDGLLLVSIEPQINNLELLTFPLQRSMQRINVLLRDLPDDAVNAISPRIEALARYMSGARSLVSERSRELALIERGNQFAARNKVLSLQLTEVVDELVSGALNDIDSANSQALKVQRDGQMIMLGVVLLALLCAVLIVWLYVDRRIVRRLRLLGDNMSAIAGGDLHGRISDDADDEIAQMASALEVFRKTAIEVEESNLREINEARLQLYNAIESISEGFCLFDVDDRLVLQNNHYRELFGLDDSHLGSSFETLLGRAMESRIETDMDSDEYFRKRLLHHRDAPGPFVQQLQDGTWLRITERKAENLGTVAIYSDITEIKQHEQALDRALGERDETLGSLEAVMNAIDYGILFLDKDLNVSSCNWAFRQIWGLSSEEIEQAKSYRDIFDLNYGDSVVESSDAGWQEYVEARIAEVEQGSFDAHEVTTRNGKTLLHQCVAIADGSRMLTYFDITPHKRVEDALRLSEERYALALSGANEALWEWEMGNTEIYVSQRFHEIADLPAHKEGLSKEEWMALIHPQDREQIGEALIEHVKGRADFFDVEYRMLGPDREYHWVQHRGAGLRREDGWVYRMAGSVGEIEARKQLEFTLRNAKEIAEQNSQFKSQFIANMSHELRTPLNSIIGITEMLREDVAEDGPEAFNEPLTRVSRAGKHLLNLINDVLDLSRIEAGKLALYPEHVEIETLLTDAITTAQHLIQQNNNRIHLHISDEVKFIYSDPLRFRQIVLNLLTNASKFTQNGDIHLRASYEKSAGEEWLSLAVSDTGIGIDKVFLDKLFVEFAQEDSSATRRYGGTGLGLTISQRLCSMMGGEISVESAVGVGTTFTVKLPAIPGSYADTEIMSSRASMQ